MFLKKIYNLKNRLICKFKSYFATMKVDEGKGKFIITNAHLKVKIIKQQGSRLVLNGDVKISSHISSNDKIVRIHLGKNSILKIDGDFIMGNGVRINLNKNAELNFGGRKNESAAGITSDTLIMVNKKIDIGSDFLCAWGVFITDSDWHQLNSQPHQSNVHIGNHVWIANNSSILKGTTVHDNCIVASNSKLINKDYPSGSMIAGTPARVVKSDISWSRDIN